MSKRFAILGGDRRSIELAKLLSRDFEVVLFGFDQNQILEGFKLYDNLDEVLTKADMIIGPVPCSNDDEILNAPLSKDLIPVLEVFRKMNKNQLFIAGRIGEKIQQLANINSIYTIDLLKREEMAVLNAIPTAEGAVQIAMEEIPITMHNANVLVLGYGRIGKVLSKVLQGLSCHVYVCARKYSDQAMIRGLGYEGISFSKMQDYISRMDVVFNTVPELVITSDILKRIAGNQVLIVDLASKPGGVDFKKAKEYGIKTIWALSLPGKVAPKTSAIYIRDTLYNIIDELGV